MDVFFASQGEQSDLHEAVQDVLITNGSQKLKPPVF
jgi:hypothetical protein